MLGSRLIAEQLVAWLSEQHPGQEVQALIVLPGIGWVRLVDCAPIGDALKLTYRAAPLPGLPEHQVELVCSASALAAVRKGVGYAPPETETAFGLEDYHAAFFDLGDRDRAA